MSGTIPSASNGEESIFGRKPKIILATIVAAALVYWVLPESMGELPRRTVAIFLIAAVFWATEAIPLFATSLCVIGLEILLLAQDGGLAPVGGLSYKDFLSPFSSGIIILFMGGFLLSAAVSKHGIDQAIAALILRPFTRSPILLVYGILIITAFFSMWMSNTATTAMMLAIIAPIAKKLPENDRFHKAVIFSVPFGANVGGIGTPIGTPPNAVALAALRDAGHSLGFVEWMTVAVPLMILMLIVVGALLYWAFPPEKGIVIDEVEKPQKIDLRGKLTLWILGIAIFLWLTEKAHGVSAPVVALLAAALLTGLQVLGRRDVDSIDWNILILLWGGLSLGNAMQKTGLVDILTQVPVANVNGFLLACAFVGMSVLLSTFMSHTAAANLIIPMAMALALPVDQRVSLVLLTALSCSFAMAMPVSTPPNAMAFATGKIPVTSLIRVGGMIGVIAVVVMLIGYEVIFQTLLDLDLTTTPGANPPHQP